VASEAIGRRFESCQARHSTKGLYRSAGPAEAN
jgi:hypothetical protein